MVKNEVELFPNEKSPLYWANLTVKEKIVVNQGGTQSGKTEAIIRVLFTIAIIRPKYIITVISDTIPNLKVDALRIARRVSIIPEVARYIKDYNLTDRIFTFNNGSLIEFKSFEDEEAAKGGKRHILYVVEGTRVSYGIFYQADLRTSVRTYICYNPTAEFWVHNKVINNKEEFISVKVLRSWHIHNPYLTQEQHDRIERIADPELKKVYARGLTGKLRGTIYSNWTEVEEFTWSDGIVWYADWGYSEKESADPTAGGRIAFNPKDSEFDYVADELVHARGLPVAEVARIFKEAGYKSGQPCYCDHSPENIRELRLLGIHAFPAAKGPGSVTSGILFMRNKKVGYTKRSENIKEELRKYKFMEIEGIVTNTPIDEWNHQLDGIRYGAHTHSLRTGQL
jgi:phage terminase large subunit